MAWNSIFFIVVGFIQMIIAVVDYYLAYKCYEAKQHIMGYVNVLAGVSWTLTSLYKFWELFLSLQTPL